MSETGFAGTKESRQEHGRRYRDFADLFEAARPCSSGRRDDSRGKVFGGSKGRSTSCFYAYCQSLEDLHHLPPPAISGTPFYAHILSSLPSLRLSIKSAVTASTKSWLFDIRESGATVGRLALEQMTARIKKWRARREKEGGVRLARVGGALEMVHNERAECESSRMNPGVR